MKLTCWSFISNMQKISTSLVWGLSSVRPSITARYYVCWALVCHQTRFPSWTTLSPCSFFSPSYWKTVKCAAAWTAPAFQQPVRWRVWWIMKQHAEEQLGEDRLLPVIATVHWCNSESRISKADVSYASCVFIGTRSALRPPMSFKWCMMYQLHIGSTAGWITW